MEGYGYSIYINTDDNGNITSALMGYRSLPDRKYTFHFYFKEEFKDDIMNYRVVVDGYDTSLVLKTEQERFEIGTEN